MEMFNQASLPNYLQMDFFSVIVLLFQRNKKCCHPSLFGKMKKKDVLSFWNMCKHLVYKAKKPLLYHSVEIESQDSYSRTSLPI